MSQKPNYIIVSIFVIILILIVCLTPETRTPLMGVFFHFKNVTHQKSLPQNYSQLSLSSGDIFQSSITEKNKFSHDANLNNRPIIGILSQELSEGMQKAFQHDNYTSYIAASYVKFVESAGARVVPILIDRSDEYYETMGASLNGFLFPGGNVGFDSKYSHTLRKILNISKKALESGKVLPVFATCLGFENLLYFESGMDERVISKCSALNVASKLKFSKEVIESQLFSYLPKNILNALANENITSNFHSKCTLPTAFYSAGLNESYCILSTSVDKNGVEYISTVEHRLFPIFGTQWHPEKAAFEWADDFKHSSIPHSLNAIQAAQALAEVFVHKSRLNSNSFSNRREEMKHLIYNFSPVFVALNYNSSFQLCYFF